MPRGWVITPSGIYFRPTNEEDRKLLRAVTGGPLSVRLGATHDEAAEAYARIIVAPRRRPEPVEPGTV